ncbi:MAG TPA: rhodanese-like domain-containing protein [Thermoanaerobaculia bacterium]|nr:rhodanese-like domain-containing protein [Thermoanaerobaculia bacterium]
MKQTASSLILIALLAGCSNQPVDDAVVEAPVAARTETGESLPPGDPVAVDPTPVPRATASSTAAESTTRMSPQELKAHLDAGDAVVIDVRSPQAFMTRHAAGAISVPLEMVASRAGNLPRAKWVVAYCT